MIFKNWINRTFGSTGALTGDGIPYDGSDSLTAKIDQVEGDINVKASQVEVDAGTDDTKFVTPLTLEGKPRVTGSDVLLAVDLTNGGANDLNYVEFQHELAWDSYDHLYVEVEGASLSGTNRNIGFVAYANATPTTFLQFVGGTDEAWTPCNSNLTESEIFDMGCRVRAIGVAKGWREDYFYSDTENRAHGAEGLGSQYDYSGGNYGNPVSVTLWQGWPTGSNTWLNHSFRLQLESGATFDAGTVTLKGIKI